MRRDELFFSADAKECECGTWFLDEGNKHELCEACYSDEVGWANDRAVWNCDEDADD